MELRHIRYFLAVAEELSITRASSRLHIEQSPLSRSIKDLEIELNTVLFTRTPRGVQLTFAGEVFRENSQWIMDAIERTRTDMRSVCMGFRVILRVAISDSTSPEKLADLLALCRQEEPELEIRLFKVSHGEQIKGMRNHTYDVGFACMNRDKDGLRSQAVWKEHVVAILPTRHPLLAYRRIPLKELIRYPLILCHSVVHAGQHQQINNLLKTQLNDAEIAGLNVVEHFKSRETMQALVAAGYGVALTGADHNYVESCKNITRALSIHNCLLITSLVSAESDSRPQLTRFLARVEHISCLHEQPAADQTINRIAHNNSPLISTMTPGIEPLTAS